MPLKIVGAALGRTGTHSLKRALEELGFGPPVAGMQAVVVPVRRRIRLRPPNLLRYRRSQVVIWENSV